MIKKIFYKKLLWFAPIFLCGFLFTSIFTSEENANIYMTCCFLTIFGGLLIGPWVLSTLDCRNIWVVAACGILGISLSAYVLGTFWKQASQIILFSVLCQLVWFVATIIYFIIDETRKDDRKNQALFMKQISLSIDTRAIFLMNVISFLNGLIFVVCVTSWTWLLLLALIPERFNEIIFFIKICLVTTGLFTITLGFNLLRVGTQKLLRKELFDKRSIRKEILVCFLLMGALWWLGPELVGCVILQKRWLYPLPLISLSVWAIICIAWYFYISNAIKRDAVTK